MTGKVCRTETVGEKVVEVCPAGFEVTSVERNAATAQVTRGDASEVRAGDRAVFANSQPSSGAKKASAVRSVGCTKDTDCKGERICQDGRCVGPETGSARAARARCPRGMVMVPAGRYRLGERGDEATVEEFCLDVTEVTAAAYGRCVGKGGCSGPGEGTYCNGARVDRSNHPVNCVDWNQAEGYCRWMEKRLPTEEEWEWAARGGERGTTYPWGNGEPGSQLCWDGHGSDLGKGNRQSTCAVGSYPRGDSPQGVKDLAGNVREWTASSYDSAGQYRVGRGGGWSNVDPSNVSAAARDRNTRGGRLFFLGFSLRQDRAVRGRSATPGPAEGRLDPRSWNPCGGGRGIG
jgi:formylglycine-generating enzyme required for sulfatase activity